VNQYDHCLATLRTAFAARDVDGDGSEDRLVPAGILWMQGESDAYHTPEIAAAYEANLKRLMDLLRAALRTDDLPVVIGRISDSGRDDDGVVWTHGEVVRAGQAAFVKKDGHAALVTSTDDYAYSDPWHYDTAGFLDLGKQFAEAAVGLHR
jgi:iduronate 2-sulfatase